MNNSFAHHSFANFRAPRFITRKFRRATRNSDALVRQAIDGDEERFVPRMKSPSLPLLPG